MRSRKKQAARTTEKSKYFAGDYQRLIVGDPK
jgi:hypothetical protein